MTPTQGSPAVFLASAARQATRMADIAERDGDNAKAAMLRVEAEKLADQADNAGSGT